MHCTVLSSTCGQRYCKEVSKAKGSTSGGLDQQIKLLHILNTNYMPFE